MVVYRTTDATKWGAGKEAKLTSSEIDNNFWEVITRLVAVENNPPQPAQISNITLTGSQLSIHLEDGTVFGPYTLPVSVMYFRGDWTALTDYFELDLIHALDEGLFLVLRDHTSAETFDPDASTADGQLYHRILPTGLATGDYNFLRLSDTPAAFGTAGQYLIVNTTADGLTFTDLPVVTWDAVTNKPTTFPPNAHSHDWGEITSGVPATIAALPSTVGTDGQVLKALAGGIVWGTDEVGDTSGGGASTLDELIDVDTTTTPPTDGQGLIWDATSSLWLPADIATGGGGGGSAGTATFKGALVQRSVDEVGADYTIAAAITWDAETYDEGGWHDNVTNNTQFVVPAGVSRVRLSAQLEVQNLSTGDGQLRILKNGVDFGGTGITRAQATDAHFWRQNVITPVIDVVDGDIFELTFQSTLDTSIDILATRSWFAIEAITGSYTSVSEVIEYTGGRTLQLTDAEQYLRCTDDVDSTLVVPLNSVVPFPLNTTIHHRTAGAGKVTVTPGDVAITLNPPFGQTLVTPGAGATISLKQVAINEWDIIGHTEATA